MEWNPRSRKSAKEKHKTSNKWTKTPPAQQKRQNHNKRVFTYRCGFVPSVEKYHLVTIGHFCGRNKSDDEQKTFVFWAVDTFDSTDSNSLQIGQQTTESINKRMFWIFFWFFNSNAMLTVKKLLCAQMDAWVLTRALTSHENHIYLFP